MALRSGIYIMHEARDANGSTFNKKPEEKEAGGWGYPSVWQVGNKWEKYIFLCFK